jgi:nitrate reductase NapE component
VIGRRTKPTFCVFPVFSVAVMEKCCDACGDGEYYFSSRFSVSEGEGVSRASVAVDRKSMGKRWVIGRRTKLTLCVFPCIPFSLHGCYGKVL